MISITPWTRSLSQKLLTAFGPRLLFLGYQGSYARGEATPQSDIDIVTILDHLSPADLDTYRSLVRSMPQGELACGFICGQRELRGWPRYDLLSLALDTKPVLGGLQAYLPDFTDADRREALSIAASGLYHGACHAYLYGVRTEELPGLLKSAFFCLRMAVLCREGRYIPTKLQLSEALTGRERDLMDLILDPPANSDAVDRAYALLISWSSDLL